ncbi:MULTISPECIES: GUN4 domain-containing protein [unclassified Microcoleus]|uniref:GUN4 domain-containing protein n=1 Tax=unclassified Microcoleus TaxID=2642155 RepID=UPI001DEBBBCB|nr:MULTISPECIES: GUN4 domain-containing protein [unclassified Microcoleus]MCC3501406.1 GUN4 domain-containing protein [Microcoleus sp. PH2017_19_SFW_U_A]TAG99316.1 MAG: hypothetical protein EAZ19_00760 [Oscillatoriales cyanobacterium]MCC3473793.1 GUN4 domain-containing protein [Microcoleus sp. PH2017_13_LAR_U_A]MCC3486230.1 GUN4 domain-containing protein [Microcoleus sp. PH2017_14_LAR_D_A]MCC3496779.1 GUN4 domain-containing protein [Microcoleus sp. PH2017_15_JOR_U_A]
MTELTQEIENLDRAMILKAVEFEPVNQGRSLVVTIGINEYVHWQKLKNAVQDAIGLQQTLIDKLGFSAPIPPLLNEAATKAAIESIIEDRLREELQENDNLVLFFAGHGHTRVDKLGGKVVGETGFIVPVEAQGPKEYWSDYIKIDPLLQSISRLPARHILVILDSCHSGFALGEAMNSFRDAVRYEKDLSSRISRKVITSARREQLALDGGPIFGHSLFTGTLIDGLNWGKADLDGNGLITSSELGLFIQQQVAQASKSAQTPDFGSFYFDDRGEMIINLQTQNFVDSIDYRLLENHLICGRWKEADQLTFSIMLMLASCQDQQYLDVEDIQNFPLEELNLIDELWTRHSNNRFGFSVQNKIWQSEKVNGNPHSGLKTFQIFGNCVGWRVEVEKLADAAGEAEEGTLWLDYNHLNFSLHAPYGHLPWVGYGDMGKSKRWRLGYLLSQFDTDESEEVYLAE